MRFFLRKDESGLNWEKKLMANKTEIITSFNIEYLSNSFCQNIIGINMVTQVLRKVTISLKWISLPYTFTYIHAAAKCQKVSTEYPFLLNVCLIDIKMYCLHTMKILYSGKFFKMTKLEYQQFHFTIDYCRNEF